MIEVFSSFMSLEVPVLMVLIGAPCFMLGLIVGWYWRGSKR